MNTRSRPLLAGLIIAGFAISLVGGYFLGARLNQAPISASAFLPYTDSYGGVVDDSQAGFIKEMPLIGGFSRGQIAWYWFVGPTNSTVNSFFTFQYKNGDPVQGQFSIVDAKPGDKAYTHFWDIMSVTVPDSYVPNTIKSLATLKGSQLAGLVTITDLKQILDGPIVARNVKTQVVNGEPQISPVWYRTQRMTMAIFEQNLPESVNVASIPIWLIQRANETYPLLEYVTGKDFNHDGDLQDSNDLIDKTPGQSGYSPLWSVSILHVKSSYLPRGFPPFPSDSATLSSQYGMFTSLQDAQTDQNKFSPLYVDLSAPGTDRGLQATNMLVNCPALALGIQPSGV